MLTRFVLTSRLVRWGASGDNDAMDLSFFNPGPGDSLTPNDLARSLWSERQMHGVAVSGALARAAERVVAAQGRTDLRPARWNVDLFRPAEMVPCQTRTRIVRTSPRLCLVDVELVQDDIVRTRATALFLKPSEPAPGDVWEPTDHPAPPPADIAPVSDEPRVPVFGSDGVWSASFADHQNAARHMTWQTGVPVISGEAPTPFVAVASIADATSMVTNWGSNGVEQINTDITLVLARQPISLEIGLLATDRVSADGIAVGSAVVFDRQGRLGTSMTSSMANAKRTVDFEVHDFADDPRAV